MTKTSSHGDSLAAAALNQGECALAAPLPYLSSADLGWEGLDALALLEPKECESWMAPVIPAVSLVFFRGGSLRLEMRYANSPWDSREMHAGSASLRVIWGPPREMRWRSTSVAPTQTLHLRLSKTLLLDTAERITSVDPASLSVWERPHLHDPVLAQMGRALWGELECPSPAGALYANTAAHFLAAHLLRCYSSAGSAMPEPPQGRLSPRQAQCVVDFIQTHLTQDLSLDALAQLTGFSVYHFTRLFRRTTGESPHQCVLRLRVERAQALLQRCELPLAEVALASGFAHQSHLTQQFKRHFGVTPSAYRRELAPRARQASLEMVEPW